MIKTGFKFIDELNCLNSGDLISIQGKCVQPEQFVISLMQNILDHNDGYILLMNRYDFYLFTSVIFDDNSEDDKVLISERISRNNILSKNGLPTDAEVLKRNLHILLAADMTFKLTAERGYKEPVDIEVIKPTSDKVIYVRANTSSLKYAEHLKDCQKLWFYEEKDNG